MLNGLCELYHVNLFKKYVVLKSSLDTISKCVMFLSIYIVECLWVNTTHKYELPLLPLTQHSTPKHKKQVVVDNLKAPSFENLNTPLNFIFVTVIRIMYHLMTTFHAFLGTVKRLDNLCSLYFCCSKYIGFSSIFINLSWVANVFLTFRI